MKNGQEFCVWQTVFDFLRPHIKVLPSSFLTWTILGWWGLKGSSASTCFNPLVPKLGPSQEKTERPQRLSGVAGVKTQRKCSAVTHHGRHDQTRRASLYDFFLTLTVDFSSFSSPFFFIYIFPSQCVPSHPNPRARLREGIGFKWQALGRACNNNQLCLCLFYTVALHLRGLDMVTSLRRGKRWERRAICLAS